ncbi:hypothetical protein CLF_108259 [Clonorchis sinensis]|uniref:Uncharacterized protein n=1 Tax=Clonorchis sinensis TaxID=79923 RepID=G7YRF5_CLOSI|nr:hypothetical protein CLF_108259 [Clonorchis sinensis]
MFNFNLVLDTSWFHVAENLVRRIGRRQVSVPADREVWWTQKKPRAWKRLRKTGSARRLFQMIPATSPRKSPVREAIKDENGLTIPDKEERLDRARCRYAFLYFWGYSLNRIRPSARCISIAVLDRSLSALKIARLNNSLPLGCLQYCFFGFRSTEPSFRGYRIQAPCVEECLYAKRPQYGLVDFISARLKSTVLKGTHLGFDILFHRTCCLSQLNNYMGQIKSTRHFGVKDEKLLAKMPDHMAAVFDRKRKFIIIFTEQITPYVPTPNQETVLVRPLTIDRFEERKTRTSRLAIEKLSDSNVKQTYSENLLKSLLGTEFSEDESYWKSMSAKSQDIRLSASFKIPLKLADAVSDCSRNCFPIGIGYVEHFEHPICKADTQHITKFNCRSFDSFLSFENLTQLRRFGQITDGEEQSNNSVVATECAAPGRLMFQLLRYSRDSAGFQALLAKVPFSGVVSDNMSSYSNVSKSPENSDRKLLSPARLHKFRAVLELPVHGLSRTRDSDVMVNNNAIGDAHMWFVLRFNKTNATRSPNFLAGATVTGSAVFYHGILVNHMFTSRKPVVGCRRIFSNLMSSALRIYMYRDISNMVASETRGGLVQHMQLPGNIANGRLNWVPGQRTVYVQVKNKKVGIGAKAEYQKLGITLYKTRIEEKNQHTSTLTPSISRYEQKNYTVTGLWATWTIKKPNDNQRTNGPKGRNPRKTRPLNQPIKETNPDLKARRKRPNHNRTITHKTVELNTPNEPNRHKRLTPGQIHKGPIKLGEDPLQNYQMLF